MKKSDLTLDTILAHAAKTARESFTKKGYVAPMWAGHTADGELVFVMPEKWERWEDRQTASDMAREIFKQKHVVMFAFMTEAWMLDGSSTASPIEPLRAWRSGQSLEHHPDRREVIFIQAEDKERCITGQYFILRPEHGKPTLSPFRKLGPLGPAVGRMFGLLKEKA